MPTVRFTKNVQRHIQCPPQTVRATSVRRALEAVFRDNPQARGYFLDEQGAVRQHVVIFVNGEAIRDRENLCDAVDDDDEIYVFQALSGG